jgi:hypothetical protein
MQFAVRVADLLAGRRFAPESTVSVTTDPATSLGGAILARCAGALVVARPVPHDQDETIEAVLVVSLPASSGPHARAAEIGAEAALRVTLGRHLALAPAPTGDGGLWLAVLGAARRSVAACAALAFEELGALEARILAGDESAREEHEEARRWYAHAHAAATRRPASEVW